MTDHELTPERGRDGDLTPERGLSPTERAAVETTQADVPDDGAEVDGSGYAREPDPAEADEAS